MTFKFKFTKKKKHKNLFNHHNKHHLILNLPYHTHHLQNYFILQTILFYFFIVNFIKILLNLFEIYEKNIEKYWIILLTFIFWFIRSIGV